MNKQAKSPLLQRSGVATVFSSLLCIVVGLALGFLFLLALDPSGAWEGGFLRILKGGFYMWPIGVGREIAQIAPPDYDRSFRWLCLQNRPVQHWRCRSVYRGCLWRAVLLPSC